MMSIVQIVYTWLLVDINPTSVESTV